MLLAPTGKCGCPALLCPLHLLLHGLLRVIGAQLLCHAVAFCFELRASWACFGRLCSVRSKGQRPRVGRHFLRHSKVRREGIPTLLWKAR